MSAIQAKTALKYVLLPGIMPRAKALLGSGFGYLAFLMAQIYGLVRLLPAGHPYLNPQNTGRFGLRHVVAEAANHLVISRNNIDQIIIFFALLAGVVILLLQFVFLLYAGLIAPAMAFAQTSDATQVALGSLFHTREPQFDIAFMMLDRVFGIPGLYESCVSDPRILCHNEVVSAAFPWPIHEALHGLFAFYSFGLLFIGLLIFVYFILVVLTETATTGTPFGQRFQNVWVPIRLVFAIGLLVPINYGLNSAQYIVLFAAKMGSGMATNGWLVYNQAIKDHSAAIEAGANPTGEIDSLLGFPGTPSIESLLHSMSLIHTCAYIEWMSDSRNDLSQAQSGHLQDDFLGVRPYFAKNIFPWQNDQRQNMPVTRETTHVQALDFYNDGHITIVFGKEKEEGGFSATGNIDPVCGSIRIPVTSLQNRGEGDRVGGPDKVLSTYFELVQSLWFGKTAAETNPFLQFGARFAGKGIGQNADQIFQTACSVGCESSSYLPACENPPTILSPCFLNWPSVEWRAHVLGIYETELEEALRDGHDLYLDNLAVFEIGDDILSRGWGGAGIWYNRIAEVNGAYMSAVHAVPEARDLPKIMEKVRDLKRRLDNDTDPRDQFNPNFSTSTDELSSVERQKAIALHNAHQYWDPAQSENDLMGNIFEDTISLIFGIDALFEMRGENQHLHPIAQLTMIGKALVESTTRNIAYASATNFAGGIVTAMGNNMGKLMNAASTFLFSTAFIGLTAGLVLYYVLPFLPFVYFFFAVANWVKGLFEAMVGAPLWALAHIRIDGEGLPGEAAQNGYFLILDIVLRPIIIVFGLIAAMLIFTAQVRVLNIIWDMVVVNVTGYNEHQTGIDIVGMEFKRDQIDAFFFTVIYTIIVYMLANASFKLIDTIPKDIMRWMGSGATAFGDMAQGPAENLSQYVAMGGMVQGQQLAGAIHGGAGQMGGLVGKAVGGGNRGGGGTPPATPPGAE